MGKSCLVVVMSAFLALSLVAQQKSSGTNDGTTGTAAEKSAAASSTAKNSGIVHVNGTFALPAAPRPTPFPGPASATEDTRAPGRLVPRYEIAGMYDYINFSPGDPFANFSNHGASGSLTYNASKWLGLTAELAGYQFQRDLSPLTGSSASVNGGFMTYLFGPRLNLRKFDHFVPFAEFLAGGAHGGTDLTGTSSQSAFALAAGGGVDVVLTKHIAWRFVQMDYLMTNFSGTSVGGNARQDNFRIGTGIVLRLGLPLPPLPPKPKEQPTASCSANPASVYAGSNDTVAVHVTANSPDSLPLTYSYTATGGAVEGTGPDARWNSSGVSLGSYTVN